MASLPVGDALARNLGANLKQLRDQRGLTQQALARLAELPRATWQNLESGSANPTLSILHKVALALQVSVEELISAPRATARKIPRDALTVRRQGPVTVRRVLPDRLPGLELDRFELPARARLVGVPHTTGTREYLTCEQGAITLWVAGDAYELAAGDVVTFRGDQRHSYVNPGSALAVGYSVVALAAGVG